MYKFNFKLKSVWGMSGQMSTWKLCLQLGQHLSHGNVHQGYGHLSNRLQSGLTSIKRKRKDLNRVIAGLWLSERGNHIHNYIDIEGGTSPSICKIMGFA